jgi:glycerate-2-kinase
MTTAPDAGRMAVEAMFQAALTAADPRRAVRDSLQVAETGLLIRGNLVPFGGSVLVIALGKAAVTMTQGAVDALGNRISGGIAITKDGHAGSVRFERVEIAEAAHPIPDDRGVRATRRALELVDQAGPDDLILALISGGGSALFEAPRPPVTLADVARVTDLLLRAGAAITELNMVRTPLSLVKGGGLLRAAGSRAVATLILSDVLGNDPRVIASGPTVPGRFDPAKACEILERFGVWDQAPVAVRSVLCESTDAFPASARDSHLEVIADNVSAVDAARSQAEEAGLHAHVIWREATGEARVRGREWAEACHAADPGIDCLLGGGEMTVTVRGDGIGGRNTEFALAAALRLHELGDDDWLIASLATDGQDGPTNVAGAVLDAAAIDQMVSRHIDPVEHLDRNDSLAPIESVGAALAPGPTGTNVNDLYIGIRRSRLAN